MAKTQEIDELKLKELEDIARGVEGSHGDVSLNAEHAQVYEQLGGNLESCTDVGGGAIMVPANELCDCVLGEPDQPSTTEKGKPRKSAAAKRSGGQADAYRDSKRKRAAKEEKETKTEK